MTKTYFKSLEPVGDDLGTRTYDPQTEARTVCQKLGDMLENRVILPNTRHGDLPDRLCVFYLNEAYSGSYRPEGVLFQTEQNSAYCSPVDLMALTDGDLFTSSYYESKFSAGYKELVFDSVEDMLRSYETPEKAITALNRIRTSAGLKTLDEAFSYNEVCFEEKVGMVPVGLIGTSEEIFRAAQQYNLPIFTTTQSYVKNTPKEEPDFRFFDFLRKSSVGALYRVGASFTIDALAIGLASGDLQSFFEDLDPAKLLRIAAYVVGINFVDYRFDVTNKLDRASRELLNKTNFTK